MKVYNAAHNKEQLLKIGEDLLGRQGYNGTGVKELVEKAGIPKGSFYNYFNSKEDFAVKVLENYAKKDIVVFREIIANKSLTPLQRIEMLYQERINSITESNFTRFCLITSLSDEMASVSPLIAKSITSITKEIDKLIADCLTEAQEMGEIKLNLDVKSLALFIENSWRGTVILTKANKSIETLNRFRSFVINTLLT